MGLGMYLAGHHNWKRRKEETNVEVFKTHYGACPKVCERVWSDLQTSEDPSLRVGSKDSPLHLLLGLRYLKAYPKDTELCGFFKIPSKEAMTKWRNLYVGKLAKLLEDKVYTILGNAFAGCLIFVLFALFHLLIPPLTSSSHSFLFCDLCDL